jgi:hypothetical protein
MVKEGVRRWLKERCRAGGCGLFRGVVFAVADALIGWKSGGETRKVPAWATTDRRLRQLSSRAGKKGAGVLLDADQLQRFLYVFRR